MRSSFFEFSVAVSGLNVARAGLNVTSNNVANASNKGYSRQYVEQRATTPITYYNGRGMIGTGAEVYGVGQLRSMYLDNKFWHENSRSGEYSMKTSQLNLMETILSGMSDTGMTGLFDNLFNTIQDLTVNSSDSTYRTNVIKSAESLSKQINAAVESLKKQQSDVNGEVKTMVGMVNSLGTQIASLNSQIFKFELDGSRANDLRDQRARLVDQLSSYVNVEVREDEFNEDYALGKFPEPEDRGKSDKRFTVLINGEEFVNHFSVNTLRTVERQEKLCPSDIPKLYDIYFDGSGKKLDIYSPELKGQLKGLIDIRDGNNSYYGKPTTNLGAVDLGGNKAMITFSGLNKADIGESGYIELTNSETGARMRYEYSSLTYNEATGEYSVEIDYPSSYTGFLEMADNASIEIGRSTPYKGVPHYINKLNDLVRNFARAMNEGLDRNGNNLGDVKGLANGYDLYGNQGNIFFSYNDSVTTIPPAIDYNLMTAENFQVSSLLMKDPKALCSSDTQGSGESNNRIILEFINIKNSPGLFVEGKISDYIVGISGELGIDVKQATNFSVNYKEVTTIIDNQRMSYSGVDVNEEMVEMTRYQQLYQAAAKLLNIIDSIYDTCINKLGA